MFTLGIFYGIPSSAMGGKREQSTVLLLFSRGAIQYVIYHILCGPVLGPINLSVFW